MATETFPFTLDQITGWIIKRRDGTVVKYNIVAKGDQGKITKPKSYSLAVTGQGSSFSDWCQHEPDPKSDAPIFTNGKINLFIADAWGAKKVYKLYDVCIDGGSVLDVPHEYELPDLYGDPALKTALEKYSHKAAAARGADETAVSLPHILKIRWFDRGAPPLTPAFWPALLKQLTKLQEKKGEPLNVLTICQGGHGRSGSALVILMMLMTEYTPLDALTHIRALHCARAIESKVQHEYLNSIAALLKREENALEAEKVSSFKDRFLAGVQFEPLYKQRIEAGKGAGTRQRDGAYL